MISVGDSFSVHNNAVLSELAKLNKPLGCFVVGSSRAFAHLPDSLFQEDKDIVWVSLGGYHANKCLSHNPYHLMMDLNDLDDVKKITGLFIRVILDPGLLLGAVGSPYRVLGMMLKNDPASEVILDARPSHSGTVLNEASWIDVETGAYATPFIAHGKEYMARKIEVWKQDLQPKLTAHLKSLFCEVIYGDARWPYVGYYGNYFVLRGPKVDALPGDVALLEEMLSSMTFDEVTVESFDCTKNEKQKLRGDRKFKEYVKRRLGESEKMPFTCMELLLPRYEYNYPSFALPQNIVNAKSTGLSYEQIEAFEASAKFNATIEQAGNKVAVVIDAVQAASTLSQKQVNDVRTLCHELKVGIKKQLTAFGEQLQTDVKIGKVVITQAFAQRFPAIYNLRKQEDMTPAELTVWTQEFRRLLNDVYLAQELRKKQHSQSSAGSFVENLVVHAMGLAPDDEMTLHARKHEAEIEVIKLLMQAEGIDALSLDALAELLATKKLEARLRAVGVKEPVSNLVKVLKALEAGYVNLIDSSAPWKHYIGNVSDDLPPIARRFLLHAKAQLVDKYTRRGFSAHIDSNKKLFAEEVFGTYEQLFLQVPASLMVSVKSGSLYEQVDVFLAARSNFYMKWSHNIVGEMIQGFEDGDEALDGVCFGTTSRWVCNEQKYPDLTAKEFVGISAIGQIASSDRYRQLYQGLMCDLHGARKYKDLFSKQVKDVYAIFSEACDIHDAVECIKKQIEQVQSILFLSSGTLMILLDEHTLYVRIDHKRKIYRFGDTNIGVLDFSEYDEPLQELYKCLHDWLCLNYSDNTRVTALQVKI